MKSNDEVYVTSNLYEASYLMANGFDLSGKTLNGNKMAVGFRGKGVKEASLEFYNGGNVEAKKYSDCYRTLKDYVFQNK